MDKEKQKQLLLTISNKEWEVAIKKLTCYVHVKLLGKTLYGAHSDKELGMNAIDYYVTESLLKLYDCSWEWKNEYNLTEQLIRIAGSIISSNVEKYKTHLESNTRIDYIPIESENIISQLNNIVDNEYSEENYNEFEKILFKASNGDDKLELLALSLNECSSFDEIEKATKIPKKDLYSLFKKLKKRCISIKIDSNYENI